MNNEAAVAEPNKSLEPTPVSNAPSLSVGSGAAQAKSFALHMCIRAQWGAFWGAGLVALASDVQSELDTVKKADNETAQNFARIRST